MPVTSSLAYVNLIRHRQGWGGVGCGGLITRNSEKADVSRNIGSLPPRLSLIFTNASPRSLVIDEIMKIVF